MTGWVCQWKPFWIPFEDSFKKALVEEWVFISGDSQDFEAFRFASLGDREASG